MPHFKVLNHGFELFIFSSEYSVLSQCLAIAECLGITKLGNVNFCETPTLI